MKAQPSWQILECCLKKMMLVITASASPVFWCLATLPPHPLISKFPGFSFPPLTPLLSCVVIWWEKLLLPTPHPLHYIWFKFYYCNKSALRWLFSALCDGSYFQMPPPAIWCRGMGLEVVSGQKSCSSRDILSCWPLGGGAVGLHLPLEGTICRSGWVHREHPLTRHQMFMKYMLWVEHYAGVTKNWEM